MPNLISSSVCELSPGYLRTQWPHSTRVEEQHQTSCEQNCHSAIACEAPSSGYSIVLNENNFREIARSSGTTANYERIVDSAEYEVVSLHNDIKKCSQVELVEDAPNAPNLGQHLILFVAPVCVFVYPHFIENTHPRSTDE